MNQEGTTATQSRILKSGRTVEESMLRKRERDAARQLNRVYLGDCAPLWRQLKEMNGIKAGKGADEAFADMLLKSWVAHNVKSEENTEDYGTLSITSNTNVYRNNQSDFDGGIRNNQPDFDDGYSTETKPDVSAQNLIFLDDQKDRWKEVKEYLGLENNADLVKFLLDMFFEQSNRAQNPVIPTPEFDNEEEETSNSSDQSASHHDEETIKVKPEPPEELPPSARGRKRKHTQRFSGYVEVDENAELSDGERKRKKHWKQMKHKTKEDDPEYDPDEDDKDVELDDIKLEPNPEQEEQDEDEDVNDIIATDFTEEPSIAYPSFVVLNQSSAKNSTVHALETLPACLNVGKVGKKMGVFAAEEISKFTRFGPLQGYDLDSHDIFTEQDLRHVWVHPNIENKGCVLIDTRDEMNSNWCRYIRPSEDGNVAVHFTSEGLYFVSVADIPVGAEVQYTTSCITEPEQRMDVPESVFMNSCEKCSVTFTSAYLSEKHFYIFHKSEYPKVDIKSDTAVEETTAECLCDMCGSFFPDLKQLRRHRVAHSVWPLHSSKEGTKTDNVRDMVNKYFSNGKWIYECAVCKKRCNNRQNVRWHVRRYHTEEPNICQICGEVFGNLALLQSHARRHEMETCEICGKEFKKNSKIKHMHRHDQSKKAFKFSCDRCGKKFLDKSNMLVHMLTHSKVKPFQCQEDGCSVGYTTKQCLQIHYKKVHGYNDTNMPEITRAVPFTEKGYLEGAHDGS